MVILKKGTIIIVGGLYFGKIVAVVEYISQKEDIWLKLFHFGTEIAPYIGHINDLDEINAWSIRVWLGKEKHFSPFK